MMHTHRQYLLIVLSLIIVQASCRGRNNTAQINDTQSCVASLKADQVPSPYYLDLKLGVKNNMRDMANLTKVAQVEINKITDPSESLSPGQRVAFIEWYLESAGVGDVRMVYDKDNASGQDLFWLKVYLNNEAHETFIINPNALSKSLTISNIENLATETGKDQETVREEISVQTDGAMFPTYFNREGLEFKDIKEADDKLGLQRLVWWQKNTGATEIYCNSIAKLKAK